MLARLQRLATVIALASVGAGVAACDSRDQRVERWATTENTNVKIDWDKVNEAYKQASGPEDLERRINQIYEGNEVISIAVQDQPDKTQTVTGFFDRNHNGTVDDAEKIFTIKREPTGEGAAHYQTVGYGPYAGYVSPFFGVFSGMLMGSMLSNMFSPRYVPVYTRPYVTTPLRASDLRSQRSTYRAQNPARFGRPSQSGRSYGTRPTTPRWGGGMRGGGRFGLKRVGRKTRPERLVA
jgi:hypothetical protein